MNYRAPHLAVNFLSENFSGTPEEAVVLDVACGSGWVAKLVRLFPSLFSSLSSDSLLNFCREPDTLSPTRRCRQSVQVILGYSFKNSKPKIDPAFTFEEVTEKPLKSLLRKLRSFGVQGPLLSTLFDTVVSSAIFHSGLLGQHLMSRGI